MKQFLEEINKITPEEIKENKIDEVENPKQAVSGSSINQAQNQEVPTKIEDTKISSVPVKSEPKPVEPKDPKTGDESKKTKPDQTSKPVETAKVKTLEEQILL